MNDPVRTTARDAGSIPWRQITEVDDLVERIIAVFEAKGGEHYDEAVTQNEHAVQTAELGRVAGASDELVAAALLHDLGHLLLDEHDHRPDFLDRDLHHEDVAARFLSSWFPEAVTEPIRLHVDAKRYLCAVDDAYHSTLSQASVASLVVQGGPMTIDEVDAFRALDAASAAADLRRWDDLAKDPTVRSAPVRSYAPLLAALATITP